MRDDENDEDYENYDDMKYLAAMLVVAFAGFVLGGLLAVT